MPKKNALDILDARFGGARTRRMIVEETANMRAAQMIHDARRAAGITQAELARRIGTTQSVIARLEDADYPGHSLTMLQKVALALGHKLQMSYRPIRRQRPVGSIKR